MIGLLVSISRLRGALPRFVRPVVLAVAAIALLPASSAAIMPITFTDEQLAHWPIMVVGYWPRAPVKPHVLLHNNGWEKWEYHTRLVVTRVIHGRLGIGNHHLLFDFGIGWGKDGKDVTSATSTE